MPKSAPSWTIFNAPVRCANTYYETIVLSWIRNIYKSSPQKNLSIYQKRINDFKKKRPPPSK